MAERRADGLSQPVRNRRRQTPGRRRSGGIGQTSTGAIPLFPDGIGEGGGHPADGRLFRAGRLRRGGPDRTAIAGLASQPDCRAADGPVSHGDCAKAGGPGRGCRPLPRRASPRFPPGERDHPRPGRSSGGFAAKGVGGGEPGSRGKQRFVAERRGRSQPIESFVIHGPAGRAAVFHPPAAAELEADSR